MDGFYRASSLLFKMGICKDVQLYIAGIFPEWLSLWVIINWMPYLLVGWATLQWENSLIKDFLCDWNKSSMWPRWNYMLQRSRKFKKLWMKSADEWGLCLSANMEISSKCRQHPLYTNRRGLPARVFQDAFLRSLRNHLLGLSRHRTAGVSYWKLKAPKQSAKSVDYSIIRCSVHSWQSQERCYSLPEDPAHCWRSRYCQVMYCFSLFGPSLDISVQRLVCLCRLCFLKVTNLVVLRICWSFNILRNVDLLDLTCGMWLLYLLFFAFFCTAETEVEL